jgi:hypothetical protein
MDKNEHVLDAESLLERELGNLIPPEGSGGELPWSFWFKKEIMTIDEPLMELQTVDMIFSQVRLALFFLNLIFLA